MDITNAQFTSVYNAATTQAGTIVALHYYTLVICFIVAATVIGLVAAVIIKFRQRPGDGEPFQDRGNVKLETIWTVIPALILATLGISTAFVMATVCPPLGSRKPDVIVNAHQWWWEYRYPKSGVVTANELYLPQGQDLLLEIRGADVAHSFWVPAFGQKMDAIPGHPNFLFLKPVKQGVYLGACSEYCGADHGLMRIIAAVVSPQEFQTWTQSQLKVPSVDGDVIAQHGQHLFQTKTCVQCHSLAGTQATAQTAPDLTHIADRKTIGAGVIANNVDNLTKWIMNPQQFKPGCNMPDMRLPEQDAHAIAVYLESLK